jgi:hypothetical protein
MEIEVNEIVKSAMSLPSNFRASIAEMLLESLDFEEDFPVSNEWMDEIEKRCKEIDERKVEIISGDEGLSQLRKKYL